jgi:hypothetical protein
MDVYTFISVALVALLAAVWVLVIITHVSIEAGTQKNYSMKYNELQQIPQLLFQEQCNGDVNDYQIPCEIYHCWGASMAAHMPSSLVSLAKLYIDTINTNLTAACVAVLGFIGLLTSFMLTTSVSAFYGDEKGDVRGVVQSLTNVTRLLTASAGFITLYFTVRGSASIIVHDLDLILQLEELSFVQHELSPCEVLRSLATGHARMLRNLWIPFVILITSIAVIFGVRIKQISKKQSTTMVIAYSSEKTC